LRKKNQEAYEEVKRFSDRISSSIIIAHGGCDGSLEELIHQLRMINDARIIIENKPLKGLNGEVCRGCSPEEFKMIFDEGVVSGSVLDFGHALCAALSFGLDHLEMIEEFMKFNPMLFHLSDGERSSEKDTHFNFGKGNLNLHRLVSVVPEGGLLTIETPRDSSKGLKDFVDDVNYLHKISFDCVQ
jgi:endonuclease IV